MGGLTGKEKEAARQGGFLWGVVCGLWFRVNVFE